MRTALVLLAVLTMASAGVASADEAVRPGRSRPEKSAVKPDAPKSGGSAQADDPDKLICTRESETGSFMSKRVCRTRAQIEADKRAADDMEQQRLIRGGNNGLMNNPAYR